MNRWVYEAMSFPIAPELTVIIAAIALLIWGVVAKQKTAFVFQGALIAVAVAIFVILVFFNGEDGAVNSLSHIFAVSPFTQMAKVIILTSGFFVMILAMGYYQHDKILEKFELPILMLFSLAGMMLFVSSMDLLGLYMSIELMSLPLYVLASMHGNSQRSSEAGLKYFVLGALSSGILLYGCSMVYGYTGTINFTELAIHFENGSTSLGVTIGLVLILVSLCFKISAVPFHMWTPDVYEGAPTPVTAFFSVAPKVAVLSLMMRLLIEPFGGLIDQWQQIIIFVSIGSMVVGAFAALRQTNIKRLLAYSSIGHVGYALVGIVVATDAGLRSTMIYMALYITMSIGMFACILTMRHKVFSIENRGFTEDINDFAGLARTYPLRAAAIAIFMLSMAGIPPFAGFWGKLFIFESAMREGYYGLATFGVVTSVVAAFYYLRIIKVMYFDGPAEIQLVKENKLGIVFVMALMAVFNALFFLYPTVLFNPITHAVDSLLL